MIFDKMLENDMLNNKGRIYDNLSNTPLLYPSSTLDALVDEARTKQQYESILDHIYRHDTLEIDSYKNVENKIIQQYFRRRWVK